MQWDEKWLSSERPDWDKVKEYSTLRPIGWGLIIAIYFVGLTVIHYFATATIGYSSTLYFGLPTLYWLSIGIAVFYFVGVYLLILRRGSTASVGDEA